MGLRDPSWLSVARRFGGRAPALLRQPPVEFEPGRYVQQGTVAGTGADALRATTVSSLR